MLHGLFSYDHENQLSESRTRTVQIVWTRTQLIKFFGSRPESAGNFLTQTNPASSSLAYIVLQFLSCIFNLCICTLSYDSYFLSEETHSLLKLYELRNLFPT